MSRLAIAVDNKWTPVLRGKIYCSPRCGGGCTKAAYDRAVKEADALATRMGNGWEPEVWENLGWHYSVKNGVATIHANKQYGSRDGNWKVEDYTVYFNTASQVVASAQTPEDALGFAIQDARTIERRIAADCNAVLGEGK